MKVKRLPEPPANPATVNNLHDWHELRDQLCKRPLVPCPFCRVSEKLVINQCGMGNQRTWVECNECGACGPIHLSELAAKVAWNLRGETLAEALNAITPGA